MEGSRWWPEVAVAGRVAANSRLRELVREHSPVPVRLPPIKYCTDNAATIASVGYFRYQSGTRGDLAVDVAPKLPIGA